MANWKKIITSGSTAELHHISASGNIVPTTTDASSLGSVGHNFSDLFLDSGGVINFDSGDVTLTHSANVLAIGGTTAITVAGNISASGRLHADGLLFASASIKTGLPNIVTYDTATNQFHYTSSAAYASQTFTAAGISGSWQGEGYMASSETASMNNLIIDGDLTVNGTTTTIMTTQLAVSESLIFLASGSAAVNVDAGIVVQSGSVANSGSAIYHDSTDGRWAVAKNVGSLGNNISSAQQNGFVVTVKSINLDGNLPHGPGGGTALSMSSDGGALSASYGVGEIIIDTSNDKDIWILGN